MVAKGTILIIDKMHLSIIPMLEQIGYEVDYKPDITRSKILAIIGDYSAVVLRSKTDVNKEFLEKATKLKLIARAGAGMDLLDLQEIKKRNIEFVNAPEGNRDALAEHTIGMLLCLLNKIGISNSQIKSGLWDREGNRGVELKNKTVALLGYGYMGRAFANRLSVFGCKILAFDKYKISYYNEQVKMASIEEIFEEADILSLHLPLNAETMYMIDDAFLNKFKKPIYFINTARGEVVKMSVIKKALESGKIIAAALDVLENEKLNSLSEEQKSAFNYFTTSDRVILTPHVAGWTHESYLKINEVLVSKIKNAGSVSLENN